MLGLARVTLKNIQVVSSLCRHFVFYFQRHVVFNVNRMCQICFTTLEIAGAEIETLAENITVSIYFQMNASSVTHGYIYKISN